ncbi:urea amidolyase family protein [Terrabacter sp. NPDC080008]|uniref:5-oxoprolinase subunit B/C family protein n=1 Tax=Terrabacter sp. NPDC080008 TaxID=3155176 RepID=UPI00344DD09C
MDARLLPMGRTAVLVEVVGTAHAVALRLAVGGRVTTGREPWTAVTEVVAAARTVLLRVAAPEHRDVVGEAAAELARMLDPEALEDAGSDRTVELPVRYDGPDLDDVARHTGLTPAAVIRAHTSTPWRVGFGGFAPGFAYLVGGDRRLHVPRRPEPRPRVPTGAVGLAGEFSGVYPQESPGGWQLLGTTEVVLWDVDRDPPALLAPGTTVRFVDAERVDWQAPAAAPVESKSLAAQRRPSTTRARRRGLLVVEPGPLALVEDLGRGGLADVGVGRSGAADRAAYVLGLRLVGHAVDERRSAPASVEATLGGLVVRARGDLLVALTGARCPATVDGVPVAHAAPFRLADGRTLALGVPPAGLRTYLAVRGGIDVEPVLGSRSTDLLSGVGPPPLQAGDVLPVGPAPEGFPSVELAPHGSEGEDAVLTMTPGPRTDWCDLADLTDGIRTVTERSNRVGIRLQGKRVRRSLPYADSELPSEGLVPGAVQVPPGGEPVLFLADHPVTGGYPVVAVLTASSLARAAQLRPGDRVRLRWARDRR